MPGCSTADACIAAASSRREPISALGVYFITAATAAGALPRMNCPFHWGLAVTADGDYPRDNGKSVVKITSLSDAKHKKTIQ